MNFRRKNTLELNYVAITSKNTNLSLSVSLIKSMIIGNLVRVKVT